MSTKEVLLEVAEKLPPDATLLDAISELEMRTLPSQDGLHSDVEKSSSIPSPAWHEDILQSRLSEIDSGKAEFLTLDEARERLRHGRK